MQLHSRHLGVVQRLRELNVNCPGGLLKTGLKHYKERRNRRNVAGICGDLGTNWASRSIFLACSIRRSDYLEPVETNKTFVDLNKVQPPAICQWVFFPSTVAFHPSIHLLIHPSPHTSIMKQMAFQESGLMASLCPGRTPPRLPLSINTCRKPT